MNVETIRDVFAPFGAVTVKRMFGGHGIYADGVFFAIESGGEFFLKTDTQTEPVFHAAGSHRFAYRIAGGERETSLWSLSATALEDEAQLVRWCSLALDAARRKKAARKPTRPRPSGSRVGKASARR